MNLLFLSGSRSGATPPITSPLDISGCALWLDANDAASITSSAGAVSQWSDKSGFSRHATQSTVGNKPTTGVNTINGKNAIKFLASSSQFFNVTNASSLYSITNGSHTAFVVKKDTGVQKENTGLWAYVNGSGPNGEFNTGRGSPTAGAPSSELKFDAYQCVTSGGVATNSSKNALDARPDSSTAYAIGSIKSGSTISGLYNGNKAAPVTAITDTATSVQIGIVASTYDPMDGSIAEVIWYNRALSNAECNLVFNYIATKWAITVVPVLDFCPSLVGISTFTTFGDSITNGFITSETYTKRLNSGLAVGSSTSVLSGVNQGINSTPMQNTNRVSPASPFPNNGRDRYAATLTGGSKTDIAIIMYGANDFGNTAQTNWTQALYDSNYRAVVAGLLAAGYTTETIILCGLHWFPDAGFNYDANFTGSNRAIEESYIATVRQIAHDTGVLYATTYDALRDQGGAAFYGSDKLHPLPPGQSVIYRTITHATHV